MATTIKRDILRKELEEASVGLSTRAILEQSDMFIFVDGRVLTFNDDLFYSGACCLAKHLTPDGLSIAVPAKELLSLLGKFPDDEVEMSFDEEKTELRIKGKRRAAGLSCAIEILLPVDEVPKPAKWHKVGDDLMAVMRAAADICGKDLSQPWTTMVHVTPKMVEATDNYRLYRTMMLTGFPEEVSIPASAVVDLARHVVRRVAVGKGWCHFRLKSKARVSVRCSHEPYVKGIGALLKKKGGHTIELPSNLDEILARAEILQDVNYDARVEITIKKNRLTVKSRNDAGWFRESKSVRFSGDEITFEVHPQILLDLLKRTHKATIIGTDRIMVETDNTVFVACLQIAGEKD